MGGCTYLLCGDYSMKIGCPDDTTPLNGLFSLDNYYLWKGPLTISRSQNVPLLEPKQSTVM